MIRSILDHDNVLIDWHECKIWLVCCYYKVWACTCNLTVLLHVLQRKVSPICHTVLKKFPRNIFGRKATLCRLFCRLARVYSDRSSFAWFVPFPYFRLQFLWWACSRTLKSLGTVVYGKARFDFIYSVLSRYKLGQKYLKRMAVYILCIPRWPSPAIESWWDAINYLSWGHMGLQDAWSV